MPFNAAANPYVGLISTLPELILTSDNTERVKELSAQIHARSQGFERVFVEIGSGSGAHLLAHAAADPSAFFIGFELRYKRLYKTAEKSVRLGLKNLAVVQLNAAHIPEIFPESSVDGFSILFPDPWSKRRWHKHRILNPRFLTALSSRLKPGGSFLYKTDHKEYFEQTLGLIGGLNDLEIIDLSFNLYGSALTRNNIPSEFEKLFRNKGLPIFLMKLQKNRKIGQPGI